MEEEIPSMEGQFRYSIDRLPYALEGLMKAGVDKVMFFGIPDEKDEVGSQAYAEDGIVQRALREARKQFPEMYLITDVCMCEYTSHGHCGVLCGHDVENDATLELLAKTALSHVEAGADMVAPSDMMDGRVRAIREILDTHQHKDIPIMSYAVKYASAFYGPFIRRQKELSDGFSQQEGRPEGGASGCTGGRGYHYGETGAFLPGCDQ